MEALLNDLYCGKRLKDGVNLEEVYGMEYEDGDYLDGEEYDAEPEYDEDGKRLPIWSRYKFEVDYRPYLERDEGCDDEDYDDPDDDEPDDDDSDDDDDDDDYYEEEYDERQNWKVQTYIVIEITDRVITGIEIGCDVYCFGDSGLGEEDPEEVWLEKDNDIIADLMDEILCDGTPAAFEKLRGKYIGRVLKPEDWKNWSKGENADQNNGTFNCEIEYEDFTDCNDEGKGQIYYVRFHVELSDYIISDFALDEIVKVSGASAEETAIDVLNKGNEEVFVELVDDYLEMCTFERNDISYSFVINISLYGGSGNSDINYGVTSRQYAMIEEAREEGISFCDAENLADLYEEVYAAAGEKLQNELEPDEDIDIDDVDYDVDFY